MQDPAHKNIQLLPRKHKRLLLPTQQDESGLGKRPGFVPVKKDVSTGIVLATWFSEHSRRPECANVLKSPPVMANLDCQFDWIQALLRDTPLLTLGYFLERLAEWRRTSL